MKYSTLLPSIIAFIILTQSSVTAEEEKDDKLVKALADYQKTGEEKNCIRVNSIRSTEVIDDQNILFKLTRGRAYLNKLPYRCPRLASENRFSYTLTVGQLCSVDTITVLFSMRGASGSTCGLGKFEVYEKIDEKEGT